jgi:hypothetical protein
LLLRGYGAPRFGADPKEGAMAKVNPIQLQKYLKGTSYPASKDDLLKQAKEHKADEKMYALLERLPDQQFENPAAVSKAVGQIDEE